MRNNYAKPVQQACEKIDLLVPLVDTSGTTLNRRTRRKSTSTELVVLGLIAEDGSVGRLCVHRSKTAFTTSLAMGSFTQLSNRTETTRLWLMQKRTQLLEQLPFVLAIRECQRVMKTLPLMVMASGRTLRKP